MGGLARIKKQGCAWASQAGAVLQNPFASQLERDCETPSLILLRKWPCSLLSPLLKNRKITGCAWFPSGEMFLKKYPQARLRVSFP